MSQQLINRSPDLLRLRNEGYDIEIKHGHLLMKNIPYLTAEKAVKYGTLVSELTLAGDITTRPVTHVVFFVGAPPCDKDGLRLDKIINQSSQQHLAVDLIVDHLFSSKPAEGYANYYDKMTTYAVILFSPAATIDPTITATPFLLIEQSENESVFMYTDTASTRGGIAAITQKLEGLKIGIVGLGGTGSYVLDLVAKTPVDEIHLFDGDEFSQHNAFRSPGAPSKDDLVAKPTKLALLSKTYSRMHRHIISHDGYVDASNIESLRGMDYVFLCLDRGGPKKLIVEQLEGFGTPFIDVGMGVQIVDDSLLGIVRVTTSTSNQRAHVRDKGRISFVEGEDNDYSRNIQIADLNALNAALAVIKWKKMCGFYMDLEKEFHTTYTIDGNVLTNEDKL
jgi:hypothetical protein